MVPHSKHDLLQRPRRSISHLAVWSMRLSLVLGKYFCTVLVNANRVLLLFLMQKQLVVAI